ncbi:alpha/beta hydrolase family protein [Actinopolymorpha pittospori]
MTGIATGRLDVPEADLSVPGGLPDPLVCEDGTPVRTPEQWWERRRPELLDLFERQMFGRTPSTPVEVRAEVVEISDDALSGRATRQVVRLSFGPDGSSTTVEVLVHLPNAASGPAPVFLALNFRGNHAVEAGPTDGDDLPAKAWPLAAMIDRGYGVATARYEDVDPDVDDFANGVHPLFYAAGQTRPGPQEWGAVGAWAWGLSRILDHLLENPRVDPNRIVVVGHSRLGKAAMWAAAQDQRFAMAVSNNSGCGGVALSRRRVGETVEAITGRFPHWFCPTFATYANREEALPIDQHQLVALVAPRPAYIASAQDDGWADPYGEFLGGRYASPVYRLLGVEGLAATEHPALSEPVSSRLGYHIRPGGHALTAYDWERFADAADRHLGRP